MPSLNRTYALEMDIKNLANALIAWDPNQVMGNAYLASAERDRQLFLAAQRGDIESLQAMIALRADSTVLFGPERRAPLHEAAAQGHLDVCRELLGHCDVNLASGDGSTALHFAARGGHQEVVSLLLAQGVNPNLQNHDGMTACQVALACGHQSIARDLLGVTGILSNEWKERIAESIQSATAAKTRHVATAVLIGGALLGAAFLWFGFKESKITISR